MANRVHGATWAEHAGLTDEPYAAKEAGPEASQRTLYPMVTGGSVVAVKYAGGVLVAADTLGFYGSLARYDKIRRMEAVGVRKDTLVAAGGDLSDYQYIVKTVEARAVEEYALDDGAAMSPAALHSWLTRMMYQRRSKMDPLWNSVVVAGCRDGKPYLGASTMLGIAFEDNFVASGIGAHLALPLLRKRWTTTLTEADAKTLLEDCMRVLFYRDTRASPVITIGKADATGASVSDPITLSSHWEYPAFTRGNVAGDGSW